MANKFILYGHGGAYNHGAEAIVKSTTSYIKERFPHSTVILSTHFKNQDCEINLPVDEYCERDVQYVELDKNATVKNLFDSLIYKSTIDEISSNAICMSIGGDNYCYDNWRRWNPIHYAALAKRAMTVLWSCSIEPDNINDELLKVLRTFDLITARESITYEALLGNGLKNIRLCSDIAFSLKAKSANLPAKFAEGATVGINISPLIMSKEGIKGIVLENILNLVKYILDNTNLNIAFIPHVMMPMDNDYAAMLNIINLFENKNRLVLISDKYSAEEYKYIISKCRFMISSRTHGAVAAYSTCVPTIALGYSVKALGIARDLQMQDYLLDVRKINSEKQLSDLFVKLMSDESAVKEKLNKIMPEYVRQSTPCLNFRP